MQTTARQHASDLIWQLWQAGEVIDDLAAPLKPRTREEGYAIQACLDGRSARPRVGWKIAATSTAGQRHIGVDGPMAGRILAERTLAPDAVTSLAHNRMRVAEPEFAFRLGRDLAPRSQAYSVDEVMAAVEAMHLAIELPDSRFADFASVGGPTLIADNACAHELVVLGPAVSADWRGLDLSRHRVKGVIRGKVERDGSGANVLGDPRLAMAWIANELSGLGITLRRAEIVTTGTCMVPLAIVEGDVVHADFGSLGEIDVSFA